MNDFLSWINLPLVTDIRILSVELFNISLQMISHISFHLRLYFAFSLELYSAYIRYTVITTVGSYAMHIKFSFIEHKVQEYWVWILILCEQPLMNCLKTLMYNMFRLLVWSVVDLPKLRDCSFKHFYMIFFLGFHSLILYSTRIYGIRVKASIFEWNVYNLTFG